MYVDADTIIKLAAVIGALTAIFAFVYKGIKWVQVQNQQTVDIRALRQQQEEDIQDLKDEQCLISWAMLACLDGLKQLNCNGPVTEAHNKLEKHLNQKAHDQI